MVYTPPSSQLKTWPAPNYDNPEKRGPELIVVNSICLGFATVFIGLRLYTRLFVKKWFGLDDIFILLAYAATIAFNAMTVEGIANHAWDRHTYDIPLTMIPDSLRLAFFGKLVYVLASTFIAYSLLAFYYRLIAESGTHWFRITLHVLLAVNIITWTSMLFAEIFICTPVQYYWELESTPSSKCHNEGPITFGFGVVKTIIDFAITSLPIPLIMSMEMRRRQRVLVSALFALGYVVTGAGIARTYFTWRAFFTNGDISWWQTPVFISSTIENNLAIICACAPTIRPLFPKLLGGPLHKVRGWISTHNPSSKSSKNFSSADPKRSSNLSALGPRGKTRERDRDLEGLSDSDVELVIQKNNDQGPQTTVTSRSNSDGGFDFDSPDQRHSTSTANASRAIKGLSTVTVGSGNAKLNPFDPRLDFDEPSHRRAL